MKRRTVLVLAAGSVAALAVTGTALGAAARDVIPAPSATTAAATPAQAIDQQRAGDVALARVGGGQVVEVERELEHGRQVWSVKVVKDGIRHEVHVDVATGHIVRASTRDDRGGRADDDRTGQGADDRGYDDHGGRRADSATDDHGHDDHGHDDHGYDDHGGRDDRTHH